MTSGFQNNSGNPVFFIKTVEYFILQYPHEQKW